VFLDLNGYKIAPPEADVVATMIQIAEGRFDQMRLCAWFKRWASKK
jgi:prophage maintenance system killer protein